MKSNFLRMREWDSVSTHDRHCILMYNYRCSTDPDCIELYLETQRFRESGFEMQDLPDRFKIMKPEQIKAQAYLVIGKPLP